MIRKVDNAIGIRDIHITWAWSRRPEGDTERLIEVLHKCADLWLSATLAEAQSRIRPGRLSVTKTSPLGETRIRRGLSRPLARSSTTKLGGALGQASLGRGNTVGPLLALAVAYGCGMSAGVILRRTPGASLRQSPYAPLPAKTGADWPKTAVTPMPTNAVNEKPIGFANLHIDISSEGGLLPSEP